MSNVNHELNLPSAGKTGLFFDGAWQATAEGQELAVINPASAARSLKSVQVRPQTLTAQSLPPKQRFRPGVAWLPVRVVPC